PPRDPAGARPERVDRVARAARGEDPVGARLHGPLGATRRPAGSELVAEPTVDAPRRDARVRDGPGRLRSRRLRPRRRALQRTAPARRAPAVLVPALAVVPGGALLAGALGVGHAHPVPAERTVPQARLDAHPL